MSQLYTCKPFIQHLIEAPLRGWTESTAYTGLCSNQRTGAVQGAMEKHAAPQDGFLEGTMDEGLEKRQLVINQLKLWGWASSGLLMDMNPHTYSSLTPWILLHVSKPAIYMNRKTEATNFSQLTWTPPPWMLTIVKARFFKRRLIILIAKLGHHSYITGLFCECLWVTIAIVGLTEV